MLKLGASTRMLMAVLLRDHAIRVKRVRHLPRRQHQQSLPIQTETRKRGAGLETKATGRVSGREIVEREFAGIILDHHLRAFWVHRGFRAKEPVLQLAVFDRVNKYAVVV